MSVTFSNDHAWFVSHLNYLHKLYRQEIYKNKIESKELTSTALNDMFDIQSPFLKDEQFVKLKAQAQNPDLSNLSRKRKRNILSNSNEISEEASKVRHMFYQFLQDLKSHNLIMETLKTSHSESSSIYSSSPAKVSVPTTPFVTTPQNVPLVPFPTITFATNNNVTSRCMCRHVYKLIEEYFGSEGDMERTDDSNKMVTFEDENETDSVIVKRIRNPHTGACASFILPPRCKFYNWDISHLKSRQQQFGKFDLIVLDPPWSNKFIRRKKRRKFNSSSGWYNTMDNVVKLSDIPIADLLQSRSLVAVWCTNKKAHIDKLVDRIFPAWGLKHVASWYWIKVTKYGDPVLEFSPLNHSKQPYERLILGVPSAYDTFNDLVSQQRLPEDGKIIVSVPSAVHSHKPVLAEILAPYLPPGPQCLELFARTLTPGWTALGNQVLSLQFEELYRKGN